MAHQPQSAPLALGAPAPAFTLQSTNGREYALPKDQGRAGTVIAFSCNHCPYVKAYDLRFNELARIYQAKGIACFAINANDATKYPDDSFAKMGDKVAALGLVYPYLHDATQRVALDFGAGCTPEFFCFDAQLQLVYTGRLDDNMDHPEQVQYHYLRDALDALVIGNVPAVQQSHPIGCSIKWK